MTLTTTYFGPVEWYSQLYRADHVLLEACESFIKQTYRNRCVIATANGPQTLTVPVEHASKYSPLTTHHSPLTTHHFFRSSPAARRRPIRRLCRAMSMPSPMPSSRF